MRKRSKVTTGAWGLARSRKGLARPREGTNGQEQRGQRMKAKLREDSTIVFLVTRSSIRTCWKSFLLLSPTYETFHPNFMPFFHDGSRIVRKREEEQKGTWRRRRRRKCWSWI
ncbi:hypothetical protein HPP92_010376 [Vanilla planifolia]|uniref:Uncharacterized protein n=1 Tax=Vanilla planifolia TaxID=51239 RepID=A0A835RAC1_VANPL|nr:hypothetical protein HPP92_010376 [Vanilla planifolia]